MVIRTSFSGPPSVPGVGCTWLTRTAGAKSPGRICRPPAQRRRPRARRRRRRWRPRPRPRRLGAVADVERGRPGPAVAERRRGTFTDATAERMPETLVGFSGTSSSSTSTTTGTSTCGLVQALPDAASCTATTAPARSRTSPRRMPHSRTTTSSSRWTSTAMAFSTSSRSTTATTRRAGLAEHVFRNDGKGAVRDVDRRLVAGAEPTSARTTTWSVGPRRRVGRRCRLRHRFADGPGSAADQRRHRRLTLADDVFDADAEPRDARHGAGRPRRRRAASTSSRRRARRPATRTSASTSAPTCCARHRAADHPRRRRRRHGASRGSTTTARRTWPRTGSRSRSDGGRRAADDLVRREPLLCRRSTRRTRHRGLRGRHGGKQDLRAARVREFERSRNKSAGDS